MERRFLFFYSHSLHILEMLGNTNSYRNEFYIRVVILMLKILSVPFAETNMEETVSWTNERIEKSLSTFIVTANPETVMLAKKDLNFHRVLCSADIVMPDGIGIIYASKILGNSLKGRVAGYDMLHALLQYRENKCKPTKLFLLGGTEEVVRAAREKLAKLYSHVQISGAHHGYFEKNSEEESNIVKLISKEKPDLLLVGTGNPKQEEFIHRYKNELDATVMIGVGGCFDVLSGKISRAPIIFRRLGLEWFYRLLREPTRIKRQIVLPIFVFQVLKHRVINGRSAIEVKATK